jgi:protein SCO1
MANPAKAMKRAAWLLLFCLFVAASSLAANTRKAYPAQGLVLEIDWAHLSVELSCQAIPGYLEAMVMTLPVHDRSTLNGLRRGTMVDFILAVDGDRAYADKIRVHAYENTAQEPMQARQLEILDARTSGPSRVASALRIGQPVPDFSLIDQKHQKIALSDFSGKVVALTFIYTRCPLPNFCFRMSNNFGMLHQRFADRIGGDLVMLSISFDPVYDQPDVLAEYARTWTKDETGWHFLTGSLADVQNVCWSFGVNFWQDEGLLTHSLHTVIIGRDGRLVANLEGNEYSAKQLGDLLEAILHPSK